MRKFIIICLVIIAGSVLALLAWGYFGQKRTPPNPAETNLYKWLCGYEGTDDPLREYLTTKPDLNFHFSGAPETPLIVALKDYKACGTALSRIEMLIKAGADVNMKGLGGPPLVVATISNRPDAVALLLKSGADVNGVDEAGYTAAMRIGYGTDWRPVEILKLLIEAGIDLRKKAPDGMTARDAAAKAGRTDLVQMMDQAGGK